MQIDNRLSSISGTCIDQRQMDAQAYTRLGSKRLGSKRLGYKLLTIICILLPCFPVLAQERPEPARKTESAAGSPASEKLISGPQVGEEMPAAIVWMTSGEKQPSRKVDLAELSKQPLALAFMHERSRPGFGLARLMSEFAAQRKAENMQFAVVVLTDDRSSSEEWLGMVRRYFPEPTQLSVADGGIEGPGTLGLNRLAALTLIVANEGKVTANFALTQVSEPTDGPAILKAMNDACGGGKIPKLEELRPRSAKR